MQEWFNSHNSTNAIHHINKMKNKNQIIILIAAEKEFENITSIYDKNSQQSRYRRMYLNIEKTINEEGIGNIIIMKT